MIVSENANVRFKFNILNSFYKAISGNNQYFLSSKGGYYNVCWGSFAEITAN